MENHSAALFFELCRLCLNNVGEQNIFEKEDLSDDIFVFTGVTVRPTDNLPEKICTKCLEIIKKIKELKLLATSNDNHLQFLFVDNNPCTESPSVVKENLAVHTVVTVTSTAVISEVDKAKDASSKHSVPSGSQPKGLRVRNDLFAESVRETEIHKSSHHEHRTDITHKEKHEHKSKEDTSKLEEHSHTKKEKHRHKNKGDKRDRDQTRKERHRHKTEDKRERDKNKHKHHKRDKDRDNERINSPNERVQVQSTSNSVIENVVPAIVPKSEVKTEIENKISDVKPVIENGVKIYKCPICSKKVTDYRKFYNHQRQHDKRFQCPFESCHKMFVTKGDLQKHVRVHTGEKPYACDFCNKSFAQRGSLKSHKESMHAGEKPD